MNYFTIFKQLV